MKSVNTILIVDDEPGARDTLEALLFKEEYKLEFACCGAEALEKAQALTPSVILLDVMMPEMDGFEVCQRLRSIPLLAEVPIIMVTALDDRESRLRGIRAGADDFITKPFDREELRARIRTITRLNRYRRLHAERAKFEWVVQQADDGYLSINEQSEIVYANSHARHFLGFPATGTTLGMTREDALYNKKFLATVQRQYLLQPQEAWTSWPEPSDTSRYLVRPESQTSPVFWLQVDILDLPFGSEGEKVIRLSDVTAQIQAQRNTWGFHTMICHKLRTPLVGILGSLEFLAQQTRKLDSPEIVEFIEMALTSTRRLHHEIEDILQYILTPNLGKSETGISISKLQPIIDQISQALGVKSISVSIQEGLSEARLVFSQQAIELIFWEILENAVKFHPNHSPDVTIKLSHSSMQKVNLQIQDNGLTLAPNQLSQMWIPYYQGEKYTTGEVQGMGLGLAMVALLVWEVGGNVQAYNRDDSPGIIIELNLPLADEDTFLE